MKKRKRLFTLLEVVIAAGLAILLLSILLGAYFQAATVVEVYSRQEEALFLERYLQHRLEEVFRSIPKIDQRENFFFSASSEEALRGSSTLVFSYDNGVLADPALSGPVLGRLYVDLEGNLTLLTWPERREWSEEKLPPFHREVLVREVKKISYQFFHIPQEGSPSKEIDWLPDWPKDLKYRPGAIRLAVERATGALLHFVFVIPGEMGVIRVKG